VEAISQEGDEDVGFDPPFLLMVDRPDGKLALDGPERLFDPDELDIVIPQLGRIRLGQVGS